MPVFMKSGGKGIVPEVKKLQDAMLRMRYASVPVVAAVRGIALGGGCELALHCAQRVAAMESYIGLVEVGVGLVPGRRRPDVHRAPRRRDGAARQRQRRPPAVPDATASPTRRWPRSAPARSRARSSATCCESDVIVPHKDELLHVAIAAGARRCARAATAPPREDAVPGRRPHAIATIKAPARQHARRRLHQRARLPHRGADRRRGLRRRRRRRLAGRPRST